MPWQPMSIESFLRPYPSSAKTAYVETDDGFGYLKAMGAPEGLQTLASEWVATNLARIFGLPTFDFALIEVTDDDEIEFIDAAGLPAGKAISGPAFITREEKGAPWSGTDAQLEMLSNHHDISRLVIFDTWVLNCDRHAPLEVGKPQRRPNLGNVFLSEEEAPAGQFELMAMDHTHCFTCGREWNKSVFDLERTRNDGLFGCFEQFRKWLDPVQIDNAIDDLRMISSDMVKPIVDQIPAKWEVSAGVRGKLVDHIVMRAQFVADTVKERLPFDRELFPDEQGEHS